MDSIRVTMLSLPEDQNISENKTLSLPCTLTFSSGFFLNSQLVLNLFNKYCEAYVAEPSQTYRYWRTNVIPQSNVFS